MLSNEQFIAKEIEMGVSLDNESYELMRQAGYTLVKELSQPTEWTKLFKMN